MTSVGEGRGLTSAGREGAPMPAGRQVGPTPAEEAHTEGSHGELGALRRPPLQRRSVARLGRILDACAELLDEVGYDGLSTRTVAERAGVAVGSVYRFFNNKRAMADALAARNLERYAERVTERLARIPPGDWRGATDAVLDEYLAMKRTAPGFTPVDFGNQIPVGSLAAAANFQVAARLTDLLSGHLGRPPDAAVRRAVLVAVESADALVRLAFRVHPAGDPALVGETRALLRRYLAGVLD